MLIRALYEAWLVGVYALFGGPDALEALLAQQDKNLGPILVVLGKSSPDAGRGLPVGERARRVSALLRLRGLPNPEFAQGAYDVLYRWESYRNAHGGLGSIEGHIDRSTGSVVVLRKRPEDDANVRYRCFAALAIFISGAHIAAIESGFDHRMLDNLAERVHAFGPPDVLRQWPLRH